MEDYPFDTWNGFLAAFERSLQSEFYGEDYPLYKGEHDAGGGSADVAIVEALLGRGLPPQEGFDGLLRAVLNGDRYAQGLRAHHQLSRMFRPLLARGVAVNLGPVFARSTPPPAENARVGDMGEAWEEEANSNYKARGVLLDELSDALDKQGLAPLDASPFYDFDSIEAADWEEDDRLAGIGFEKARMMVLKGHSKVLGGNPRRAAARSRRTRRTRRTRRSRRRSSRS